MNKLLYRMRLIPDEDGLQVITEEWACIHETDCFYHCVSGWNRHISLKTAKQLKCLKRISKGNSRFAFDTKEKALEHLKFLKRKQLRHLKREQEFINAFLSAEKLEECRSGWKRVPDSRDLVHKHLAFD